MAYDAMVPDNVHPGMLGGFMKIPPPTITGAAKLYNAAMVIPSAINIPFTSYALTTMLLGPLIVKLLNTAVNVVVPVNELGTTAASLM